MSFEQNFKKVLASGQTVLQRMCCDKKNYIATVDVLRAVIQFKLQNVQDEIAKTEMGSAMVLFKELHPNNTEAKFSLITSLGDQILKVATSLSEDSSDDAAYYKSLISVKSTPLHTLMKSVLETVHYEWTKQLQESVSEEEREYRRATIHEFATVCMWLLYFALSILFCGIACHGLSFWKCLIGCIPFLGQLFSAIMACVNWGLWEGVKITGTFLLTGLFLGGIVGGILDSNSKKKDTSKVE